MRRISILNLLLLVAIVGVGLGYWESTRQLAKKELEIGAITEVADRFREELGRIKVVDPDRCQARMFSQRYPMGSVMGERKPVDFRFRVYLPDASKLELRYKLGELPKTGFPEDANDVLFSGGMGPGPAELAIIAHAEFKIDSGRLMFAAYRQNEDVRRRSMVSQGIRAEELPIWNGINYRSFKKNQLIAGLEYSPDEPFDLDKPVLLIKKCAVKDGKHIGFMMWIDSVD